MAHPNDIVGIHLYLLVGIGTLLLHQTKLADNSDLCIAIIQHPNVWRLQYPINILSNLFFAS